MLEAGCSRLMDLSSLFHIYNQEQRSVSLSVSRVSRIKLPAEKTTITMSNGNSYFKRQSSNGNGQKAESGERSDGETVKNRLLLAWNNMKYGIIYQYFCQFQFVIVGHVYFLKVIGDKFDPQRHLTE